MSQHWTQRLHAKQFKSTAVNFVCSNLHTDRWNLEGLVKFTDMLRCWQLYSGGKMKARN